MDCQVELLCLPPHSTTVLQPLDIVTLTKIKTTWRKLLVTHNTRTNSEKIDKKRFSYMIGDLWRNHILPSHCSSGFSRAGIFPYDSRAVSKEKLFEPPALSSSDAPSNFIDDIGLSNRSVLRPTRSLSCTALSTDALAATTTPLQQPNLISSFAMTDDALTTTDDISSNLPISLSSNDFRDLSSSMVQSTKSKNRSFTSSILEEVNQILYSQPVDPCDNSLLSIDANAKSQQDISSPIIQPIEPPKTLSSIEDPSKNNSRNSLEVLTSVISSFLTPTVTANTDKKKHRLDRPYGESLTTVEALNKVQEKENQTRKRKKAVAPKQTCQTKKAPAKRGRKPKNSTAQTSRILGFDDPPSDNESIDQPMTPIQVLSTSYTQPTPSFMYQTQ
ncbi:unnamed protein product, partial [Rotaria sp. Silwood1]